MGIEEGLREDEDIKQESRDLELLPDGEWLFATISNVDYRIKQFMGKPVIRKTKDDKPMLDANVSSISPLNCGIIRYLTGLRERLGLG